MAYNRVAKMKVTKSCCGGARSVFIGESSPCPYASYQLNLKMDTGLTIIDVIFITGIIGTLVADRRFWNAWRYVALTFHVILTAVYIFPALIRLRVLLIKSNQQVRKPDTLHIMLSPEVDVKRIGSKPPDGTLNTDDNKNGIAISSPVVIKPDEHELLPVSGENKLTRKLYWVTFATAAAAIVCCITFTAYARREFECGHERFSDYYSRLRPGTREYTNIALGTYIFHLAILALTIYTAPASNRLRAFFLKTCCLPLTIQPSNFQRRTDNSARDKRGN